VKVVGVFVRFRAPLLSTKSAGDVTAGTTISDQRHNPFLPRQRWQKETERGKETKPLKR
jgi:hypothetical protein